jgi:hypothetical protein
MRAAGLPSSAPRSSSRPARSRELGIASTVAAAAPSQMRLYLGGENVGVPKQILSLVQNAGCVQTDAVTLLSGASSVSDVSASENDQSEPWVLDLIPRETLSKLLISLAEAPRGYSVLDAFHL